VFVSYVLVYLLAVMVVDWQPTLGQ